MDSSKLEPSPVPQDLTLPILLSDRLLKTLDDSEFTDLKNLVQTLSMRLRSAVRFALNSKYNRPIHRIFADCSVNLERALAFARKRSGVFRRVGAGDYKKVVAVLEASIGDLIWLLSVYDGDDGCGDVVLSLPPIASTNPILSWVWSYIVVLQKGMDGSGSDRVEVANALANLALDSDRNKKIIIEEEGLPHILNLLKDASSVEAQIAAADALSNLASNEENVSMIVQARAVPIIVKVLSDSPMKLQTRAAKLISVMAFYDPVAKEEFAMENAIRPLVSLLTFEVQLDDFNKPANKKHTSIHSVVQGISSTAIRNSLHSDSTGSFGDHHHNRKERENESPEVKLELKVVCAEALCMLSRGSISNSRKITETKGLLCLSKLVEKEKEKLQYNCLMTLMEIASVAETNEEIRRSTFKTNSPAAKSVVDQLLNLVTHQGSTPGLKTAAIKSIGSLARTFPARETRVMSPLVGQLEHWNPEVASEAAIALGKFANPENYLHVEHSKAVIEFGAVPSLLRLIRSGEKTKLPALVLLCWLALHVPNSEALERVLGTFEAVAKTAIAQHPSVREMLPRAIASLELYRIAGRGHK